MFELGYFPATWTEGLSVPIHKKEDIDNPKIINGHLNFGAEKYN